MKRNKSRVRAFTLIEMLIAMAVTLLLMAALGKGFAYVGENIRDSRTQVSLANELRDITNRLQTELSTSTAGLKAASIAYEPSGYLTYYEGPVTDATSSLFLPTDDPNNPTPESRYGDFDDYLAFTAVATGDSWFTGKVPRFILDQKIADIAGTTYTPGANALDPVVIKSKYAEIVYFASPEYEPGSMVLPDEPSNPLRYRDLDNNLLPDKIRLHRRVLLIRPDLNITPQGGVPPRLINGVNYLLPDTWSTGSSATLTPAAAGNGPTAANAWLFGMAAVHQQCDLSLRRVVVDGVPQALVAANSLEDLAKPHNRFAHVRVPGAILGIDANFTSMPILALGNAIPIFGVRSLVDNSVLAPPLPRWSGFLRPEFVLGNDRVHLSDDTGPWGINRLGEDVIANDVLAFDVKVYDTQAPVVTTVRTAGNGTRQVVTPNEPGFREAMRRFVAGNAGFRVDRGGYVDLMYPILSGGSMRGWTPRYFDPQATTPLDPAFSNIDLFRSQFSGVRQLGNTSNSYLPSLYRSGKILAVGGPRILQPTWDTFTNHYQHDGLEQSRAETAAGLPVAGTEGNRWRVNGTATPDRFWDGVSGDNNPNVDSSPPFLQSPESIQITIRLENVPNRAIKQLSVVYRDTK